MERIKTAMVRAVENKTCPPCLEEREVGSFGNLTSLCIPYLLAGVGWWWGGVGRHKGMNWGKEIPNQNSNLLPSFNASYIMFEQVWLTAGEWNPIPPHPGMQSNSPVPVDVP